MSEYAYICNQYTGQRLSSEEIGLYQENLQPWFSFPINDAAVHEMLCDSCTRVPSCYLRKPDSETYPWLYQLECSNNSCRSKWYLCRKCNPQSFRTSPRKPARVKQLNRRHKEIIANHHTQYHQFEDEDEEGYGMANIFPDTEDHAIATSSSGSTETDRKKALAMQVRKIFDDRNYQGCDYFVNEIHDPGSGILSIISSALTDSRDPYSVTMDDAITQMMLTRQFLRATKDERIHNTDIYARMNSRYQKDIANVKEENLSRVAEMERYISFLQTKISPSVLASYHPMSPANNMPMEPSAVEAAIEEPPLQRARTTIRLAIPTHPNDARKYLEGNNCVLSKIPCPPIRSLPNGYAYVRVKDVITILLAKGIATPQNTPGTNQKKAPRSCYNKPALKRLLEAYGIPPDEKDICLLVTEWTDGVETATGKKNRGSLKATTLTIECPSRGIHHTFVVAAGKSKSDHSEYRNLLYAELKELAEPNWYYDGQAKKMMKYRILHYATIADRPEVSECTGIAGHNGLYSTVPGTCFPAVVAKPHPDRKMHVEVRRVLASCQGCYDRRLTNLNASEVAKSRTDCTLCCDWDPEQVEWKILSKDYPESEVPNDEDSYHAAFTVTFERMRKEAEYAFTKYLEDRWNSKEVEQYLRTIHFAPVVIKDIIKKLDADDAVSFNESYLPAKMQSTATIDLYRHLPGVMHLLFLGLAKTLMVALQDLLKKSRSYAPFHDEADAYMRKVRSLSLQFCKAWNFGSKTTPSGPWVAENYLGFVRLMKAMYSRMHNFLPQNSDVSKEKIILAEKAMYSFVACVSRVMQEEYDEKLINEAEVYLKLFLSDFEELDIFIRSAKAKPKAEETGNLLYLLRLPSVMRDFGPLREFWEGSIRGEGIFRYVKPLIRRGIHHPGACMALLTKYYNDKMITWILEGASTAGQTAEAEEEEEDDTIDETTKYLTISKRYSDVHCYTNQHKVATMLQEGSPLSLVESSGNLYAKYKQGSGRGSVHLAMLEKNTEAAGDANGTPVLPLTLSDEGMVSEVEPEDESNFLPCLALPWSYTPRNQSLDDTEDTVVWNYYYLVSPKWKEMNGDGHWILPVGRQDDNVVEGGAS